MMGDDGADGIIDKNPMLPSQSWGFDDPFKQSAVLIPPNKTEYGDTWLLAFASGNWCIVTAEPNLSSLYIKQNSSTVTAKQPANSTEDSIDVFGENLFCTSTRYDRKHEFKRQNIFTHHRGKVCLVCYNEEIDHCFTAEVASGLQTRTNGGVGRIWSPRTLVQKLVVENPLKGNFSAADFSSSGDYLCVIGGDGGCSILVYSRICSVLATISTQNFASLTNTGEVQNSKECAKLLPTFSIPCIHCIILGINADNITFIEQSTRLSTLRQKFWNVSTSAKKLFSTGENTSRIMEKSVRFVTFGMGHLRVWTFSTIKHRFRSCCISWIRTKICKDKGGWQKSYTPEVTAACFINDCGDIAAATSDYRIYLYRGVTPIRSFTVQDCSARIILLNFTNNHLLLGTNNGQVLQLSKKTTRQNFKNPKFGISGTKENSTPFQKDGASGYAMGMHANVSKMDSLSNCSFNSTFDCSNFINTSNIPQKTSNVKTDRRASVSRKRFNDSILQRLNVSPIAPCLLGNSVSTPRSSYADSFCAKSPRSRRYHSRDVDFSGARRGKILTRSQSKQLKSGSKIVVGCDVKSRNHIFPEYYNRVNFRPLNRYAVQAVPKNYFHMDDCFPQDYFCLENKATRKQCFNVIYAKCTEPWILLTTKMRMVALDMRQFNNHVNLRERPLGIVNVAFSLNNNLFSKECRVDGLDPKNGNIRITKNDNNYSRCSKGTTRGLSKCKHQKVTNRIFATGGSCFSRGELTIWEIGENFMRKIPMYTSQPITALTAACLNSSCGKTLLVSGGENGELQIVLLRQCFCSRISTPTVLYQQRKLSHAVTSLGISKDCRFLAVGTGLGLVTCFEIKMMSIPPSYVCLFCASPAKGAEFNESKHGFASNDYLCCNPAYVHAKSPTNFVLIPLVALSLPIAGPLQALIFSDIPNNINNTPPLLVALSSGYKPCFISISEKRILPADPFMANILCGMPQLTITSSFMLNNSTSQPQLRTSVWPEIFAYASLDSESTVMLPGPLNCYYNNARFQQLVMFNTQKKALHMYTLCACTNSGNVPKLRAANDTIQHKSSAKGDTCKNGKVLTTYSSTNQMACTTFKRGAGLNDLWKHDNSDRHSQGFLSEKENLLTDISQGRARRQCNKEEAHFVARACASYYKMQDTPNIEIKKCLSTELLYPTSVIPAAIVQFSYDNAIESIVKENLNIDRSICMCRVCKLSSKFSCACAKPDIIAFFRSGLMLCWQQVPSNQEKRNDDSCKFSRQYLINEQKFVHLQKNRNKKALDKYNVIMCESAGSPDESRTVSTSCVTPEQLSCEAGEQRDVCLQKMNHFIWKTSTGSKAFDVEVFLPGGKITKILRDVKGNNLIICGVITLSSLKTGKSDKVKCISRIPCSKACNMRGRIEAYHDKSSGRYYIEVPFFT